MSRKLGKIASLEFSNAAPFEMSLDCTGLDDEMSAVAMPQSVKSGGSAFRGIGSRAGAESVMCLDCIVAITPGAFATRPQHEADNPEELGRT